MGTLMIHAGVGGALIGTSAAALLACNGRIAGISGIINGIYPNRVDERNWRLFFLASLLLAAETTFHFFPSARPHRVGFPALALIVAGFLVGYGTRMGGGCTSGHGVCGLGRLSRRSFIAVITFVATAVITVAVTRHVIGILP